MVIKREKLVGNPGCRAAGARPRPRWASWLRSAVAVGAAALVALLSAPSSGQTGDTAASPAAAAQVDPKERGKLEFQAGQREFNLGNFEKALGHFETSYRLTSAAALLYNIGVVNQRLFERTRELSRLERAIDRYRSFLVSTQGDTSERALERRAKAEEELKAAEQLLSRERASRAKGEETLAVGEDYLLQLKMDEAAEQVAKYRKTPGSERAGVVRAYLLEAGIAVAQEDKTKATEAFARALSLDRSVALPPGAGPVASESYKAAEAKVGEAGEVDVSHTPPGSLKPKQPVVLEFPAAADAMRLIKGVKLSYRAAGRDGGGGAYTSMPPAAPGAIQLPESFTKGLLPGAAIEYYAVAEDAHGAILEHLGAPELPFVVEVEKPAEVSVARKWYFWVPLVAVVAGGAAAGVAVPLALQEEPPTLVPINVGQAGLRIW